MGLLVSVAISGSVNAQDQSGRGMRWVRSHPFYLSALSSWADGKLWQADQYRQAGFNTLLAWDPHDALFQRSADAGLPFH
ncbi:MAG: hypothetical protein CMJ18_21010 [Phycisphaeraceae bacterium]|nr:hypothetical protein [Phycisphaeraceae bacterium]